MSCKILIIEQRFASHDRGYYGKLVWVAKSHPEGEIIFGGPDNAGGVDGEDLVAVFQAAVAVASVVHAPMLEVTR